MDEPVNEWIEDYRKGNVEALSRLVEHFRRPLFGFILKMTEARGDADEIFQEVWFRAIRSFDLYRGKSFLSWLFRIAHNLIIDRSRKDRPMISLENTGDTAGEAWESRIQDKGLTPEAIASGKDLGERIRAALSNLPPEQREVFYLRMEADRSFKEIASIQGVSINTALARMQYALSRLRKELGSEYQDRGTS
jgi:RNA polymerase sigma-70 factor (ECF subfamily)